MAALEGRHAFVTGGGRGIGAAVARALTAEGARVTIIGRTVAPMKALIADGRAVGFGIADVTNKAALDIAVNHAVNEQGPIDVLVNNAGAADSAPFARTDDALFDQMMAVNFMSVVHLTRAVLPAMTERGFGRVINVASLAGLRGYAYVTAYCAAKHAVVGFTRALALETARTGVTVNAVCPGYTDTELLRGSIAKIAERSGRTEEAVEAELTRNNPQKRLIKPAEVASLVAYLCKPEAEPVHGQAIAVGGGEVMR